MRVSLGPENVPRLESQTIPCKTYGWRDSGRYPICYREGCKTVRLPPLHGVRLLSLLPADGLEGGTLKLEKCGFGPSSHSAPSFSVSSGGDVIKTPGHQGLQIRGTARHADGYDVLAEHLITDSLRTP